MKDKKVVNDKQVTMKEKIQINWHDVIVRSVKTFIQSFISYLLISINGLNFFNDTTVGEKVLRGFLIGAASAGVCAVWNSVLSPLLDIDGTPTVKVVYVDRPVIETVEVSQEVEDGPGSNG